MSRLSSKMSITLYTPTMDVVKSLSYSTSCPTLNIFSLVDFNDLIENDVFVVFGALTSKLLLLLNNHHVLL